MVLKYRVPNRPSMKKKVLDCIVDVSHLYSIGIGALTRAVRSRRDYATGRVAAKSFKVLQLA